MYISLSLSESLTNYKKELEQELEKIFQFWTENTIDKVNGGFYGKIDNTNKAYPEVPRGSVLNSRILWAFSAGYALTKQKKYFSVAERAFRYLKEKFIDKEFGGVFWTVDHKGSPLDNKKQFYALSFAIYGLAEFAKCSKNDEARSLAIELYHSIIAHSYDKENGGYIEALSRDWKPIQDLRLSKKDANEKKSMNTHLHILEGFTNLFSVWPDEGLKLRIREIIEVFFIHIINNHNHHLRLFFDEKWNSRGNIISYGHDIEAAWLIQEAAGIIDEKDLIKKVEIASVQMANAAAEGLDSDGGLWYEYETGDNNLVKEKHWWPQSEAMIGFFNAWQITGRENFLALSLNSWRFVKDHILDKKNGEWFWGVRENYDVMDEDKAGVWKCPYHNSRACIEIIKRIEKVIADKTVHEGRSGKN